MEEELCRPIRESSMLLVVLSGFLVALFAPFVHRLAGRWSGWLFALLPVAIFIYLAQFIGPVASAEKVAFSYAWLPSLEIDLTFRVDGLSLLFALLISGIGALVIIYSGGYLDAHPEQGIFFSYLLAFMGSMLGLVLADNVLLLFVFWELTSLSSYFLIGFDHRRAAARNAALQALLVTGLGGLALLAGLILMGTIGESLKLSELMVTGDAIRSHSLYLPILLLVVAGAFTKSAQVPFHFWLPNAMEAPAPVSCYLHSATMVKAGIYLLARLSPVLGETAIWKTLVTPFGALTMATGAYLALVHTDLKRILAYTTISALGMMTMLLGIGGSTAFQACVVLLLAHALYKAALFLVAGVIDHATGTREVSRLGGLFRKMPIVAIAGLAAAMSSAGVPPHIGFIGKELVFEALLTGPGKELLVSAMLLTSISFVAVACLVGYRPFFGQPGDFAAQRHQPGLSLWLGPAVLAGVGLVVGIKPSIVEDWLVAPAVAAIEFPPAVETELALWHGFHVGLLFSAFAFAAGLFVYWKWSSLRTACLILDYSTWLGPARWYEWLLTGVSRLAQVSTRVLQSGHLHFYLLIIVITAIGLIGSSLTPLFLDLSRWSDARVHELVLAAVVLAATMLVVRSTKLITAVVSLGVVGYGVALFFLFFSAPDLAMTQFAIESLSVVLLALVLFRLPEIERYSKQSERIRDAVPALIFGGLMTVLVLTVTALSREARLAPFFAEHSFPDAKGLNVVNVILVDFRGLDTMGEITVLSIAAIGVFSLLKLFVSNKDNREEGQ
jgi:multicomponent Na+:H+ antiporter subunit A